MTDKELRKMSRRDLIEIIYNYQTREEELERENQELRRKVESRDIAISHAGSIAEAALALNGVFEAAQAAADQYIYAIRALNPAEKSEEPEKEENKPE